MAEFTPITTQEQLDALIGERIRRAETKAAEKFADYDTIKAQNDQLAAQIAQLTDQVKAQTQTAAEHEASVNQLTAKVQEYETASVKTRIALEVGLPYQMAERLQGADEKAIRADAEAMKGYMGTPGGAPLGSNEPTHTGSDPDSVAKAKFGEWFGKISN